MLVPILVFVSIAFAYFLLCCKWPDVARIFVGFFFLGASLINSLKVLPDPQPYVEGYGLNAIELCRQVIEGPFTRNPLALVPHIAAGQFTIGILLLLKGSYRKIGLAGAILFLVLAVILPSGIGSGLPSQIIMVAGLVVLYWYETSFPSPKSKEHMDQPQHLFSLHTKG